MTNTGVLDFIQGFFSNILLMFNSFVVPGFQTMTPLDIIIGIFAFGVSIMIFKTLFHEFANNISINSLKGDGKQYRTDKKRLNDEKKLLGDDLDESDNEIKIKPKINKEKEKNKENEKIKEKKFMGNKRTREEIEQERQKKINKRKKMYRNLKKTNKFGQPLMKYQIANLFQKIKKKKKEGII